MKETHGDSRIEIGKPEGTELTVLDAICPLLTADQ
jgi:hypothetical protein